MGRFNAAIQSWMSIREPSRVDAACGTEFNFEMELEIIDPARLIIFARYLLLR